MKIYFELEENERWISPIRVAEALIKHSAERELTDIEKIFCKQEKISVNTFDCDDLMQIAEYLKVYCKYNREDGVKNV